MKLLHVIRTLDPGWGGPIEGARNISGQAKLNGVEAEIVCQDNPDAGWLANWRVPVHAIGSAKSTYGYDRRLDAWLRENVPRFDALVVHGIWMYFSLAAWKATRRSRTPYYLFTHGMLDPWFKRMYPWKHLKKAVYWRLFQHKVLRDAAAVLFTSEEERLLADSAFLPYECKPVVVGYGVAPPPRLQATRTREQLLQHITASYPDLRNRKFALFLGRIHEKKGIDLLLQAFASEKDHGSNLALVIAGPGNSDTVRRLRSLAETLGVSDRTVWTGPLYGEAKWETMRAAEVFALPSHQENFGISIAEALACGTPVLISNKVNIWREIDHDGAGLVDSDDAEGTTRLLRRWSRLAPTEREVMGRNALRCFSTRFDMTTNCKRLFELVCRGRLGDAVSVTAGGIDLSGALHNDSGL